MAVRNIATSDTLETFRTQFNAMTLNDFGDIATLNAGLTATTIVGSVNEIYTTAIVGKNQGTNFTGSLLVGHTTTGTLNAASFNTGIGIGALDALTSGDHNTAVGNKAGTAITDGLANTFVGAGSGEYLNTGLYNTGVGSSSLWYSQGAQRNTAIGYRAMMMNAKPKAILLS